MPRIIDPRLWAVGLALFGTGCEGLLEDIANGVEAPKAALNRVDLLDAPSTKELVSWQCVEAFGTDGLSPCPVADLDNKPKKKDLIYSFDLVFDLSNPNDTIPIPLVEALLGMNVYEDQNLGSVCVSFCDPDDEDCVPGENVEDACRADEADEVKSAADVIPTVEDLVGIAESIARDGVDNGDWRWVEGGETVEAHLQFDLFADTMLDLTDEIINDALTDALAGEKIKVDVPYAADGSVFFDVPELGRKAIGFGPTENTWTLKWDQRASAD